MLLAVGTLFGLTTRPTCQSERGMKNEAPVSEHWNGTHAHRVNADGQYHSLIVYLADSTICAVRLTKPSALISTSYIPNSWDFVPTSYIKEHRAEALLPQLFVLHV